MSYHHICSGKLAPRWFLPPCVKWFMQSVDHRIAELEAQAELATSVLPPASWRHHA